jgi:hypothetical protein
MSTSLPPKSSPAARRASPPIPLGGRGGIFYIATADALSHEGARGSGRA